MTEEEKYEIEKLGRIYDQWCEDFRSLQTVFWRVPFFAMTITGGVAAAVFAFDGAIEIKRALLVFIGVCNFILILIAWRVRKIMEKLLVKIFKYEGLTKPKAGFFVLKCFSAMFAIVSIVAILAAFFFPDKLDGPKKSENALVCVKPIPTKKGVPPKKAETKEVGEPVKGPKQPLPN